jgi:hypothetical protein
VGRGQRKAKEQEQRKKTTLRPPVRWKKASRRSPAAQWAQWAGAAVGAAEVRRAQKQWEGQGQQKRWAAASGQTHSGI